jgi:N-acetylmuramoyl-L-alanine amidase
LHNLRKLKSFWRGFAVAVVTAAVSLVSGSGKAQAPPAPGPATSPLASSSQAVTGPVIVLDAAHGGDDSGSRFTDTLAEKDVTLALARRIRTELEARGFVSLMMRDADSSLSFDQRAAAANAASATLYLAVHASTLGSGVRIYSARMPAQSSSARSVLVAWGRAQAAFTGNSRRLAAAVGSDLTTKNLPTTAADAPVLPLNAVGSVAMALEVSPPLGSTDLPAVALNLPSYQQTVAVALAESLAAERSILTAPVKAASGAAQ